MPLAATRTSTSSGRGSASSSVSMTNGPDLSRTTAALTCIDRGSLVERLLHFAVLVLRRIHDHLTMAGHVLLEPITPHVLELHEQQARGLPLAELVETDLAHDGIESVAVDVLGERIVIDAFGRRDRLFEHLHGSIRERRLIKAKRIDAGVFGARLVLLEEVFNAWVAQLLARHIHMVVHQAIELVPELPH